MFNIQGGPLEKEFEQQCLNMCPVQTHAILEKEISPLWKNSSKCSVPWGWGAGGAKKKKKALFVRKGAHRRMESECLWKLQRMFIYAQDRAVEIINQDLFQVTEKKPNSKD